MTDYVLIGLVKRRAELAGEIERMHDTLRQLVAQLEHLDATILQFDPEYKAKEIKPSGLRPRDWAKRGQMSRIVLHILRHAAAPLSVRDIAYELLTVRGLDRSDRRLMGQTARRVAVALRLQRDKGLVQSEQKPGKYQLWAIAGVTTRPQ